MKIVQNILLFLSICLFFGLVYISFFNVYQTDDFIFSYSTQKLGLFNNIFEFYSEWGGRYFGYSINMFNPVAYDERNILPKIYPVFLLISFIGVLALNFTHFFKYDFLKGIKKSFIFFFIYTVLLVSLPEHYFWITGSNIYFLTVILSALLFYLISRLRDSQSVIYFFLCIFLVVLLMGSNEILALLLLGSLIVFFTKYRSKKNFLLLVIGIVFLSISFLSPGNFTRLGTSDQPFVLLWVKRIAIMAANSVYIILKTMLIIPLFIKVFEEELNSIYKSTDFKTTTKIWLISFLPLVFLSFILNTIGRQFENLVIFYFLTSTLFCMSFYKKVEKFWWVSAIVIFLPATTFFPVKFTNFNIDYNLTNIGKELFQTDLNAYNDEVIKRIKTIDQSSKDSLIIDKINNVPKILYFQELPSTEDESNYINNQLEKYYNKKYIRIK